MENVSSIDGCTVRAVDAERVRGVQERSISTAEAEELADQFKMLADPTRTRILYALLEGGELCVCDLAAAISAPETSVSHALRLLRAAKIVRNRRDGRMVYYRLADAHVRMLLDVSREHLQDAEA